MRVQYTAGIYIIESAGIIKNFINYIQAKDYIDSVYINKQNTEGIIMQDNTKKPCTG